MTVKSTYPAIDIPELDLWTFFFERKDRAYPDTTGKASSNEYRMQPFVEVCNNCQQCCGKMPTPEERTRMRKPKMRPLHLDRASGHISAGNLEMS